MYNKKTGAGSFFFLSFLLVTLFLLSSKTPSYAEEIFDLGEVVITTTRFPRLLKEAPGSVTVIDEEQIKTSQARNVGEILKKVAGVNIKNYGLSGMGTVSIRGSSSEQVLVMVDGRALNLASSGNIDLSLLSLENVKKIEVARGPFSALYGSGALGGVVNIITKKPPEAPVSRIEFSYGSFNTSSYDLAHGAKGENLGYLITASKQYTEGDRENSWRDTSNLMGKITYSPFVISGGYWQGERGVPGSLSWPTPNATQEDKRSWFDITSTWDLGKSDFLAKGFINQDKVVYQNPDSFGGPTKDTTENRTYGVTLQHTVPYGSTHHLIWGADWKKDIVQIKTIDGTSRIGGKRERTSTALYLQDEITMSSDLTLTTGARYDNYPTHGSQISPRINMVYHLTDVTSVRASWGKAFRSPTVNELYWEEDWGGGMGMFGNPDLAPEKSSEQELGIEHIFSPRFLGRITLFSTWTEDLISWTQIYPGRWEVQNIYEASIKGIEGEMRLKPWDRLSCSLNYTYLEAKDEKEFEGNFLPYRPQNEVSFLIDYELQRRTHIQFDGSLVGKRYADRENTEKISPYTLLGARITVNTGRGTELFLKADNLLDEEYENIKGYPMPGLTIGGGIEIVL